MPPKSRKSTEAVKQKKSHSCLACNKEDNMRMVRCDNCDGWYHFICVGVTSSVAHQNWCCRSCSVPLSADLTESTQVPNTQPQIPVEPNVCAETSTRVVCEGTNLPTKRRKSLNNECSSQTNSTVNNTVRSFRARSLSPGNRSVHPITVAPISANNNEHCPAKSGAKTKGAAKSTCSRSSRASSSHVRRLHAEMQLIREQQLILSQRETLMQQKGDLLSKQRELLVQLEAEEDSMESDDGEKSCVQVESWLRESREENNIPSAPPRAESTTAAQTAIETHQIRLQDSYLETILQKLTAMVTRCSTKAKNVSASTWLPSVLPINATCVPIDKTTASTLDLGRNSSHHINRDQLAARSGICKDLPKFTGNPEEWPLFIASYEQTTELCAFSDYENLIRLRQALDGPARNAVRNLLLHASCVPQILSTLRMKFGRPELIIDVLLTRIRDMPPPKESRPETIVDFAIEVQNICATMKASGLINHLNNPELEQDLVCKLPGLLGPFWGMQKLTLPSSSLEDFSDWLLQLAHGANSISIPSTSSKIRRRGALNIHTDAHKEIRKEACIICQGNCSHVAKCNVFSNFTRSEKWKRLRAKKLCRRCLNAHNLKECPSTAICGIDGCRSIHHPLLHKKVQSDANSYAHMECNTHSQIQNRTLFRILPVTLYGNGTQLSTFAFFDDGSSLTLADEDLIHALNLKGVPEPLCLKWTANSHRYEDDSHLVDLEISAAANKRRFPLRNVRTVKELGLPSQTLNVQKLQAQYEHLKGLPLTSYSDAVPKLLIGLNNCKLGLSLRSRVGANFEPIAEKTALGWTIKGQPASEEGESHHVFHTCECENGVNAKLLETVVNYFCLDNLGLKPRAEDMMPKDTQHAIEQLQKFTHRSGDCFETTLLWKAENIPLPDSIPMAKQRAQCLYSKLQRDPSLGQAMQSKIDDYVAKGYARKLNPDEIDVERCWYLPLFSVSNPNKPGKLRLVSDAAARVNGISLNSLLLKGPDLLTSLVSTIRRFRQRRVAIGGDIAEMYHQVKVRREYQNYQRFFWIESNSVEPVAYVMTVMTFGATCSPSCAQFVKNKNAEEFREQYPRAVECILENHYVDDMLDSVDTEEEAIKLAREVHLVHSKGGFLMRNWVSNSQAVLDALTTQTSDTVINLNTDPDHSAEKVLGMWWSTRDDCFIFKLSKRYKDEEVLLGNRRPTKREVLSLIMTIFDPLGLLAFYVMYAKIIFQGIWRSGCGWDEQIHDEQFTKWLNWIRLMPEVTAMSIPRCYVKASFVRFPDMEVHTFVDASEDGYAAVCYIRSTDGCLVDCVLLGCKTKVAPLKMMSVPRLELQAAVLGARLTNDIISSHSIPFSKVTYWSDSRTVLAWIRSDHRRYRQFVAHRVSEIIELTDALNWRWVPTAENVADEATKWQRIPDFSNNSRWLNGPAFLKLDPSTWPNEQTTGSTDEELRAQFVGHHANYILKSFISIGPERFSSWKRLINATAAVIFYARKWRDRIRKCSLDHRSPHQEEFLLAEVFLLREVQTKAFAEEIILLSTGKYVKKSSSLYKLTPYNDENSLLRLGGRVPLSNGENPIILPRGEYLTILIVSDYHSRYHHANHETVVNEIRQKFWIPRLRTVLNEVRRKCQMCLIYHAQPQPPKMSPLPTARLASFCRPFSYVGVDYFGPITVSVRRSSEKRYGVLLTCLTTRALHLEIAYSLSTDSCIIAIRNFISRRGSPIEFWSDNGTNFKGAECELRQVFTTIDQNEMVRAFTTPSMKWRFIPPASPHMGGAWERLVRSVKDVLYRILPSRNPSDELLRATLMEIEMTVNSRPLTHIPINHEDEEALTPNHFLLGSSNGAKPLGESTNEGMQLRRNWQAAQQLSNAFWKRWVREYLPIITRRSKWFDEVKPIEIDDVVYLVDPNHPRNVWPKGRVEGIRKGTDGRVRSAIVRTTSGLYERPAAKIAVLDICRRKEMVGPLEDIPVGSVATDLAMPLSQEKIYGTN